jgi:hypothetical protein
MKKISTNKLICLFSLHKKEKIHCPYTKTMYNVCNKCRSKDSSVVRFQ